jgi:hypothetical protein
MTGNRQGYKPHHTGCQAQDRRSNQEQAQPARRSFTP